jgi:type II secretory pathway pseudopilin PulG
MVEIAISLAVIGIALVAIIGVLPIGMNTQRDNREETIINQDATILIEAIRSGSRGLDDLTNYVYAITNYWTNVTTHATGVNGYTTTNRSVAPGYYLTGLSGAPLTNGMNIVGLLSTPEYTDDIGRPIPTLLFGGYSNHVVAYVRSLSGPVVEKPPQDNDIIRGDSFGYRVLCVNAPVPMDTNLFYLSPVWAGITYNPLEQVFYKFAYWQAPAGAGPADIPGQSAFWARVPVYGLELGANLRELRLSFFWPQQPNGSVGSGRQAFRTQVTGQLTQIITNDQRLYFYQSQSFATTP